MAAVTARTPGNGTGTLSYTLTSDTFDIESVYVAIDATGAAGPVTAELTISDQSGAVIARKTQGATVAAGGTGSATWALRLDDESTATSGSVNAREALDHASANANPGQSQPIQFSHNSGSTLFDTTGSHDVLPVCLADGIYAINCMLEMSGTHPDTSFWRATLQVHDAAALNPVYSASYGPIGAALSFEDWPIPFVWFFAAGDTFEMNVFNGDPVNTRTFAGRTYIQRIS